MNIEKQKTVKLILWTGTQLLKQLIIINKKLIKIYHQLIKKGK